MAQISVVQGARSTQTINAETRNVRFVEDMLQQLEPDEGPLTTILSSIEAEVATDTKAEWFEDQLLPDFDVLAGALQAGDATMTVTNYQYFRSGDLVRVNDNEVVKVTATPAGAAVSIARGYGSIAAAAAPVGARLFILSDTSHEFDSYRDLLTTQKVNKYNYLQELSTPVGFTNGDLATNTFAGQDEVVEQGKAIIEHKKKMEKSFLLGQPYLDETASYPARTSGGLDYFIRTNVRDVSAGFTEPELEDFIRVVFRYGSKEKMFLGSPKFMTSINGFARSKIRTFNNEDTYGLTISKYENAGRSVMLVEEKLLTNNDLNDLTGIAGWAFLIDPNYLKMHYLKDNATMLHPNLQNPGVRGRVDEVRCTFSLQVMLDQVHGLLTGVQD